MSTKRKSILYPAIFTAFFLFLLFPSSFFVEPGQGPAASGSIVLHLARQYRLIFGKDIVSIYGPLGVLGSRLPIAVSLLFYLAFDVYFLLTAYLILRKIVREHFHFAVIVFVFLAIFINLGAAPEDWFFFFFLFYLFAYLQEPSRFRYLVQAGILAVIGLYFRVDTGMFGALLYAVAVIYAFFRKKISIRVLALSLGCFIVITLLAGWMLHVNLRGYIVSGLHLLDNYGEARFEPSADKDGILFYLAMEIMVCLVYWIGCLIVLAFIRRDEGRWADELFPSVAVLLAAIIYFKTGFVRADDGQVFRFFGTVSLLICFVYLYGPGNKWRRIPIMACWIVLVLSSLAVNLDKRSTRPAFIRLIDLSFLTAKFQGIGNYFTGLWHYSEVAGRFGRSSEEVVDSTIKTTIGSASADIIPWQVSRIWSNGLRYEPRPAAQSFWAYSAWLDSLNYQKYMSATAPDFVLFSSAGIDGHFPFFDEARTKLAIITRYDVAEETENELVLRNTNRHRLARAGENVATVRLNTDIPIKKQDSVLQFSRFIIHYDGSGKFARMRDLPPALRITLTLSNGSAFTYRISKSVLEDGVIINKYVDGEEELQLLLQAHGRLTPNISQINIQSDSSGRGFIDSVTMINTYYSFRDEGHEKRVADSAGIAALYSRSRPEPFPPSHYASSNFPYQLEEFNTFSQFIRVKVGFPHGKNAGFATTVRPVLRSRDHFFRLPVLQPTGTGFISVAAKDLLPPGDYELGLARDSSPTASQGIVSYTGRHLFLRSNYKIAETGPVVPNDEGNVDMKYNVDRAVFWKGELYIEGWAKLETRDTGKTTTNIVLSGTGRAYRLSTDPVARPGVNGPDSYSGFSVMIPESRLARDRYIVGIEQTCCNGRYHHLQYTSRIVEPGNDHVQVPFLAPSLPPVADYLSGIDRYDDQKEFLTIEGWAIRDMAQVQNARIDIVLQLDSAVYLSSTIPEKRSDLTAHYNNGFNLDNCGFSAQISKEGLPPGRYKIGLWVRPKDGPGSVKYVHLFSVKLPD